MRRSLIARSGLILSLVAVCGIDGRATSAVARPGTPTAFHLRLIVSSLPPSILDVDSKRLRRVAARAAGPALWLSPVPGGALASVGTPLSAHGILIRADGSARSLVVARSVVGAWNMPAAWALSRQPDGRCVARLVPGTRAAIPAPCGSLEADGPAGLVVLTRGGEALLDHRTGRLRARVRGDGSMLAPLHAGLVFEMVASVSDGQNRIRLVDLATGHGRALRWPSELGEIDGVVAEPGGPLVAVGFASPGSSPQGEDIFLLDSRTGRFTHVPGYPILEDLKRSSVAWTSDGRLVMTIGLGSATTLAVYRPGDRRVSRERIHMPAYAGSDTFVPITSRG
jgi:hypothetical protein